MLLFVGLGNPGSHMSAIATTSASWRSRRSRKRHGFSPWKRRFQGVTAEGTLGGERVLLLLPGHLHERSPGARCRKPRISTRSPPSDIVVFQDEVELPPAKLRVKTGGGNAGHNGLRSITNHFGNDYRRVRLGIGHPGVKELVHGHVLSDFSKADRQWVEALCAAIADNAELIARGQDATLQNKVHLALTAKGFRQDKETDK